MAYWIYSYGLPIQVGAVKLLQGRKLEPVDQIAKSPRVEDLDEAAKHSIKKSKIIQRYQLEKGNERQPVKLARDIMKSPVVLLEDNTQFSDAWLKFQQYRFRHFPIVDGDNNLVGIVSDRDMLARVNLMSKAVSSGETDELVSSVMKEAVITASEDTSIHEICQVMFSQHIGALPIIGANHTIKGIITRSDILRTIIKNEAMEFWV